MDIKTKPFIAIVLPMGVRSRPDRLVVSCCVNINKYFEGFSSEPAANIATAYADFYKTLQELRIALSEPRAKLSIKGGPAPTNLGTSWEIPSGTQENPLAYLSSTGGTGLAASDYRNLKDELWREIFPPQYQTVTGTATKIVNDKSRVANPQVGKEIVQMASAEELPFTTQFINEQARSITAAPGFTQGSPRLEVDKKLEKIHEFGRVVEQRALMEKFTFTQKYLRDDVRNNLTDPAAPSNLTRFTNDIVRSFEVAIDGYLDPRQKSLDIDELIHSFSALSKEPVLMRLMGLVRDFEITLPPQFVPVNASRTEFYLAFELNSDAFSIPTKITGISHNGKYAYLVAEDTSAPQFFSNSILKVHTNRPGGGSDQWQSHLYQYDKVAQELRLKAAKQTQETNSGAVGEDPNDSFTRGIIFGNTGLAEMVKPADYPFLPADSTEIPDDFAFTAQFVSHGHRVTVVTEGAYHSLTGRRLELTWLKSSDREPFFVADRHEGCIHFDAVSNFVQGNELKSCMTDALFEYSGELLGLKSAFSREIRVSGAAEIMQQTEANDDGGVFKSQQRIQKVIDFTYFPEEEVINKNALLSCHYDIPKHLTPDQSPRLRFSKTSNGRTYTFAVYEEYLNGWGLPLLRTSDLQLSVEELTKGNATYLPPEIDFCPLETKKPVLLFHTKDFGEGKYSDSLDETRRPIDQESLEALVVWSEDAQSSTHSCRRHVLPARIAFEHAFWYGLLSQMPDDESFNWKKKYNCPFVDKDQYKLETGENKQPCPEDACGSYCGGTLMRSFYGEPTIVPNHLSDPSIVGFEIEFFRDRECNKPIHHKEIKLTFGGTPGVAPQSYLLDVDGSSEELSFEDWYLQKRFEIRLKKGLRIWAQLKNVVSDEYLHHLDRIWYHDLRHLYGADLREIKPAKKSKNPPRTISLVHAVKKPVIDPEIHKLSSTPVESYKYEHVRDWLRREYPDLTVDSNVVAQRLKMHEAEENEHGSTRAALNLQARFERLDAFVNNNKIAFVPDETPTGGLELWMRKEEFLDDPDQFVLDPETAGESAINHLPEQPVLSFADDRNKSLRDHRIEFTEALMQQLKKADATVPHPSGDIFRDIVSNVSLAIDARSTHFEERRYKLRNISSFKGYFTNKQEDPDDDYATNSAEHRVLFLNNKRPEPPKVSHVVTTVREVRTKKDDVLKSTQKGNIVTCYLKRRRLRAGKNERVGVIVYNTGSRYHKVFKDADMISKTGRDIVSDRDKATASPFIRYDETHKDILISDDNEFDARFEKDLSLISYLPKFDIEKQLWKFEVELNIRNVDQYQLHNPFVQFSLVHYQPYSINYNEKCAPHSQEEITLADVARDFRLSAVESFVWCYLLPERTLTISFDKPGIWGWSWTDFLDNWGNVDLTIAFDYDSLHHFNRAGNEWLVRSNFIVSVEGSDDKVAWYPVKSKAETGKGHWAFMHPLLTEADLKPGNNEKSFRLKFKRDSNPSDAQGETIKSREFSHFRVRLVEVEWFDDKALNQFEMRAYDVVEDERLRIRYVELIY